MKIQLPQHETLTDQIHHLVVTICATGVKPEFFDKMDEFLARADALDQKVSEVEAELSALRKEVEQVPEDWLLWF